MNVPSCDCPDCSDDPDIFIRRIAKGQFVATLAGFPFIRGRGKSHKKAVEDILDLWESAILGLN